jgi:hypothetical protein
VKRLDLHARPRDQAPLVVAVGGSESSEFIRQSRLLAERGATGPVAPRAARLQPLLVVDAFAERGQPLHDATLGLF